MIIINVQLKRQIAQKPRNKEQKNNFVAQLAELIMGIKEIINCRNYIAITKV